MASVYRKNNRWYLRVKDAQGRWRDLPSKARTKQEAKNVAADFEAKARRQADGQEPMPPPHDMTVGDLCEWWLANRCPPAGRMREGCRLRLHVVSKPIGQLQLRHGTPAVFEDRLREMLAAGAAPASANGLRRVLHSVYSRAAKAGLWSLQNPLDAVETFKVPKRVYVTLSSDEVGVLLDSATPEWRGIFATAVYAGLRKGEIFGLRKTDVDLEGRTLTVARSYDNETTKGGHADVLPIAEPLVPFLEAAIASSNSDLVFPNDDGGMCRRSPRSA